MKTLIISVIVSAAFVNCISAQSGGVYEITQSVISNGGGNSSGGIFSLDGTVGQTVTEQSSQAQFSVQSGFWQSSFAPTAAGVSVSGRVLTNDGRGLRNAVVILTDSNGLNRTTLTGTFGFYRFNGISVGQTVVISIKSKLYQFQPLVVSVNENLSDVNFVPLDSKN